MLYDRYVKRILDFFLALLLLLLAAPIMLAAAVLIKLDSDGPVIFKQKRPGKNCAIFTIYKFRTMHVDRFAAQTQGNDMHRITRAGKLLRKTSIDELPQLFNVLSGTMSFIGPRPLMVKYLDCYTPEQLRRHEVLPGISGYAQVNGRNALSWDQKFEYDVWYVDHHSFVLDLKLVLQTIVHVMRAKDTSIELDKPTVDFVVYLNQQKSTDQSSIPIKKVLEEHSS